MLSLLSSISITDVLAVRVHQQRMRAKSVKRLSDGDEEEMRANSTQNAIRLCKSLLNATQIVSRSILAPRDVKSRWVELK